MESDGLLGRHAGRLPDVCAREVEEGEQSEDGYFALSTEEFDVTAYLHLGIPNPAIPTGRPASLVCPCGQLGPWVVQCFGR